jgi:hypothetical protein
MKRFTTPGDPAAVFSKFRGDVHAGFSLHFKYPGADMSAMRG